jgi:hypothetical protein
MGWGMDNMLDRSGNIVEEEEGNKANQAEKMAPMESVAKIKIGALDANGLKVTAVLAKDNEFAIYEIEHENPDARMKVFIDGYTDASEKQIKDRFNAVKQEYILAKGFLSNATTKEVMKQRIAHTLATCLSSDRQGHDKENTPFRSLIDTLENEHSNLASNRVFYLAPSWFAVIAIMLICLWLRAHGYAEDKVLKLAWTFFSNLLACLLGGAVSMLANAKSINFLELSRGRYVALGFERIVLACMAGGIVFIAIKSGLVFSSFAGKDEWAFLSVMVLAGFSETFVPNLLDKMNKERD